MKQFSDTTNYNGIIQTLEREVYGDAGIAQISGNTTKLKLATVDVNDAMDDYTYLAIENSGTWQWDDPNHTKYPTVKANIVSGQRDYSFTVDEQGYYILDIYKIAILQSATATLYEELIPIDVQSDDDMAYRFHDTATGVPAKYDKTANGIIFDVIPNYSATGGLLAYINREATHFTTSDTTKVPGIPVFHVDYLCVRAAERYARRNSLAVYAGLRAERLELERNVKAYFGSRQRDVRKRLTMRSIRFR